MVPRKYLPIFILLASCFALWGLLNNMTDNLVPSFQKIFMTSQSTAGFVQISFYGAYSVIAILASLLIQKKGYRIGVLVGLGVYCIGAAARSWRRPATLTSWRSATRRRPSVALTSRRCSTRSDRSQASSSRSS